MSLDEWLGFDLGGTTEGFSARWEDDEEDGDGWEESEEDGDWDEDLDDEDWDEDLDDEDWEEVEGVMEGLSAAGPGRACVGRAVTGRAGRRAPSTGATGAFPAWPRATRRCSARPVPSGRGLRPRPSDPRGSPRRRGTSSPRR